jgi:catechol 2,3-dioxygenase-like lactoylglutathione lyase family enzyme
MATRKPRRPAPAARKKASPARPQRTRAKAARPKAARPKAAPPRAAARKRAAPAFVAVPSRARRSPETLRLREFSPGFTVDDLQKSVAFYTGVLGFIVSERWTDDGGKLRGVMLKAGVCELGLSQDDWAKGRDRKKGEGVRIWCETAQDVDALAARIRAAGHELTEGPRDSPWGRNLSLDDPDGYHLTFNRPSE